MLRSLSERRPPVGRPRAIKSIALRRDLSRLQAGASTSRSKTAASLPGRRTPLCCDGREQQLAPAKRDGGERPAAAPKHATDSSHRIRLWAATFCGLPSARAPDAWRSCASASRVTAAHMHASRALSAWRKLHCGLRSSLLSGCGRKHMAKSRSRGCAQVGKAFIQQYYTVLHSRPKYLHRFYTNNSSLTIGEQDGPPSTTVTGQAVRSAPFPLLLTRASGWPVRPASTRAWTQADERPMSLQDIHDLWMKLELEGASAAITSVDAQASHCQGVVVFVTGQLQRRV